MISLSSQKIKTKNLNSDPHILTFQVLDHQLYIGYLNITSDHEIEAATHMFS